MIYVDPLNNSTNQYSTILSLALSKIFGEVEQFSLRKTLNYNRGDIVVLNWFENSFVNDAGRLSLWGCGKFFYFLIAKILRRFNVVLVKHNKYPHSAIKGSLTYYIVLLLLYVLESISNTVIVHSKKETKGKGYSYVPHPLYNYHALTSEENKIQSGFFVFGAIKKYKKIEDLIRIWPDDLNLTIYGLGSEKYVEKLNQLIDDKRIKIINSFVDDSIVGEIFINNKVCVINHIDESAIVSGVFFLAKSYGNSIVMLDNGSADCDSFGDDSNTRFYHDEYTLRKALLEPWLFSRDEVITKAKETNGQEVFVDALESAISNSVKSC